MAMKGNSNWPLLALLAVVAIPVAAGIFMAGGMKPTSGIFDWLLAVAGSVILGLLVCLAAAIVFLPLRIVGLSEDVYGILIFLSGFMVTTSLVTALVFTTVVSDETRVKPLEWLKENHPGIAQAGPKAFRAIDGLLNDRAGQREVAEAKDSKSVPRKAESTSQKAKQTAAKEKQANGSAPANSPVPAQPSAEEPPSRSSIERDLYMTGLVEAYKVNRHEKVVENAKKLHALGQGVPAPVDFFMADSMTHLSQYAPALEAVNRYLGQGSTARYYEDALKVRLRAEEGLDKARQEWNDAALQLMRSLAGEVIAESSWQIQGRFREGEEFTQIYNCRIYSRETALKTQLLNDMIKVERVESVQSNRGGGCKNSYRGERDTLSVGNLKIDAKAPYYMEISVDEWPQLSYSKQWARCFARWEGTQCKDASYGALRRSDGSTYWVPESWGYSEAIGVFSKLAKNNGVDTFRTAKR